MVRRLPSRVRSFRHRRLVLLSLLLALFVGFGLYGVAYSDPAKPASLDRKAPAVYLSFPADRSPYNGAGWAAGCRSAGFCGTAQDDGSGVASVSLSLQQVSTGKYWTGTGFSSASAVLVPASGTTSWSYAFPAGSFPADGDYTVVVRSVDVAGNASGSTAKPTIASFTIDTIPPPAPVFRKIDTTAGHGRNAHFEYTDSENGVTFACRLDGGGYLDCGPARAHNYHGLSDGAHTFCVKAVDKAGNASPSTCHSWNVGAALPYQMGGSTIARLRPGGPAQPIKVTFDNPNSDTVLLTTLSVSVTGVSGSCSVDDFEVTDYSGPPFEIAVGSSDLDSYGAITRSQWPTIRMLDKGAQDGCAGATVGLSFTGAS